MFLLEGVLTQNFNIVDLVNFFGKNSKTSHSNWRNQIEDDIMQNHEQKKRFKNWKKSEEPSFYGPNKLLLSIMLFNLWLVFTTWLHVGAPQQIREK